MFVGLTWFSQCHICHIGLDMENQSWKILSMFSHLLISHEFDCSFWGDFYDVDSVTPPQRGHAPFFNHLLEPTRQTDFVGF